MDLLRENHSQLKSQVNEIDLKRMMTTVKDRNL